MRALLGLLAALLVLPGALAATNISFYIDGQPAEYVNLGSEVRGEIRFTPADGSQLAQINSDNIAAGGVRVLTSNCARCSADVTITTAQEVPITIKEDLGTEINTTPKTLRFKVDNTNPQITDVGVRDCTGSCAYSTEHNTVRFTIADTGSGVSQERVSARMNGEQTPIQCSAAVGKLNCNASISGRQDTTLTITAHDRAGNEATESIELRYDGEPPRILGQPTFAGRADELPGGQPVTLEVVVRERERATLAYESERANATGECTRTSSEDGSNDLLCTATVTFPNDHHTAAGTITVTDAAGNTDTRTLTAEVLEADTETEPNFWEADADTNSLIDPNTWTLHDKKVTANLELAGPSSADIAQISVKSCRWPDHENGVSAEPVVVPGRQTGTQRHAPVVLTVRSPGAAANNREAAFYQEPITCELDVTTRVGNTVFTIPETETVNITPEFITLPTPAEMLKTKKQQAVNDIQDRQDNIRKLQAAVSTAQVLCSGPAPIEAGATALNTAAAAAQLNVFDGQATARKLEHNARRMHGFNRKLYDTIGPYCSYVSCQGLQSTPYGKLMDNMPGFDDDSRVGQWMGAVGGSTNPQNLIDPYKSKYVAYATYCAPAILYHWQVELGVDCQYQACLNNAGETGMTPKECAQTRDYQHCRLQKGAVWNALPYANIYEGVLDRVKDAFNNPLGMVGLAASSVCQLTNDGEDGSGDADGGDGGTSGSGGGTSGGDSGTSGSGGGTSGGDGGGTSGGDGGGTSGGDSGTSGSGGGSGGGTSGGEGDDAGDTLGDIALAARISCNFVDFGKHLQEFTGVIQRVSGSLDRMQGIKSSGQNSCQRALEEFSDLSEQRTPFAWGQYCGAGYCTYSYRGQDVVVTSGKVYSIRPPGDTTVSGTPKQRVHEELYGGDLAPYPCSQEPEFCDRALGAYDTHLAQIEEEASQVPGYDELNEKAKRLQEQEDELRGHQKNIDNFFEEYGTDEDGEDTEPRLSQTQLRDIQEYIENCDDCTPDNVAGKIREEHWTELSASGVSVSEGVASLEDGTITFNDQTIPLDENGNPQPPEGMSEQEAQAIVQAVRGEASSSISGEVEEFAQNVAGKEKTEEELEEARKEFEESMDERFYTLLRAEYSTAHGAVRKHFGTMVTYGRLGKLFGKAFGENLGIDAWSGVRDSVEDATNTISGEEQLVKQFCEDPGESPNYQRALSERSGGTAARISAYKQRVDGEYQYRVDVYVKLPEPLEQEADIILVNPGKETLATKDLQASIKHLGEGALRTTSSTNYRQACIEFEEDLREYFPVTIGADPDQKRLCAQMQGERT